MKITLHLVTFLIYIYTMAASKSMIYTKSSNGIEHRGPMNSTAEKILYNVVSEAILSPSPELIRIMRYNFRRIGGWIALKENDGTFIGRCFGVARQIKFAMPIIMVKLGVIVTILIFLTIFSMKTIGLLLIMFMFGASSFFTKLALFKHGSSSAHYQKPQDVHFHIHQGKHAEHKNGHVSSPWELASAENYKENDFVESHADFQEKLNYLSQFQKGHYTYSPS